jgi:Spy/CpxP family protein refolding chaperone
MNGTRGLVIAIVASFIVGFSAGMVGGIVFSLSTHPSFHSPFGRHDAERGPRGARGPVLHALESRLDLSPDQRARIEAILDSSRVNFETVRDSTRARVERTLTPEQRERWKTMDKRIMRERRGPGPREPWRMDRP